MWIFVCVKDLERAIQSTECLLISKYLCWLSVEEDMYVSLAESWGMQNDMEKCKNSN